MQFLYCGDCNNLNVTALADILELMAAASFFQLNDLLRFTESRCTKMANIDNVIAIYIHAKVCMQNIFFILLVFFPIYFSTVTQLMSYCCYCC